MDSQTGNVIIYIISFQLFVRFSAEREAELDNASREGLKFAATCEELMTWITSAREKMESEEPVSGKQEVLKQQMFNQQVSFFKIISYKIHNLMLLKSDLYPR